MLVPPDSGEVISTHFLTVKQDEDNVTGSSQAQESHLWWKKALPTKDFENNSQAGSFGTMKTPKSAKKWNYFLNVSTKNLLIGHNKLCRPFYHSNHKQNVHNLIQKYDYIIKCFNTDLLNL